MKKKLILVVMAAACLQDAPRQSLSLIPWRLAIR